ncbi:MAG: hypothetical protein J6Y94_09095 [Bacteriovoracaceae bacterium]|nr:hypothetical protein [Bacteriovoracaceae bacterium]
MIFLFSTAVVSLADAHSCAGNFLNYFNVAVEKVAKEIPDSYLDPENSGFALSVEQRAAEARYANIIGMYRADLPTADTTAWTEEILAAAKTEAGVANDQQVWPDVLGRLFNKVIINPQDPVWEIDIAAVRVLAMLGDYLFPFFGVELHETTYLAARRAFWQNLSAFMQRIGQQYSLGMNVDNDLMVAKVLAAIVPEVSLWPEDTATYSVIADFAALAERFFTVRRVALNPPLDPAMLKMMRQAYRHVYPKEPRATFPVGQEERNLYLAYRSWNRLYAVLRNKLHMSSFVFAPFDRGPMPLRAFVVEENFDRLNSFSGLAYLMGHYALAAEEMFVHPWPKQLRDYLANRWMELEQEDNGQPTDSYRIEKNFLGMVTTLSFFYERPGTSGVGFKQAFADLVRSYQQEQRYYFQYYEPVCDMQREMVLPLLRFMQNTMKDHPSLDHRGTRPFSNIVKHFKLLLPRNVILGAEEEQILAWLKKHLMIKE